MFIRLTPERRLSEIREVKVGNQLFFLLSLEYELRTFSSNPSLPFYPSQMPLTVLLQSLYEECVCKGNLT